MKFRHCFRILGLVVFLLQTHAKADQLLYAYEGNIMPLEAGWYVTNACDSNCSEFVDGEGRFVATWPEHGDRFAYAILIAQSPVEPPPTLWFEWHYRSNHAIGPTFYSCDGRISFQYENVHDSLNMYGDAATRFGGGGGITGLEITNFHTYRFESLDGVNYVVSVDGVKIVEDFDERGTTVHFLDFGGRGGCLGDWVPDMRQEWDFIRYGTISAGERIVLTDPPIGFLNWGQFVGLDSFTVTFDAPNYIYIDDITVEVSGGAAPEVVAIKRLDNGPPELVQVILDRPLPPGQRTTFTFSDGQVTNIVAYTFQHGDIDADGDWDLFDFSGFQNCHFSTGPSCPAYNFAPNGDAIVINALDYILFHAAFTGP